MHKVAVALFYCLNLGVFLGWGFSSVCVCF